MLKCRTKYFPALQGAAPSTTVYSAGALGTLSFSVIAPRVLVIESSPTGFGSNSGSLGGSSNWSRPSAARAQLILMKSWHPAEAEGFAEARPGMGVLRRERPGPALLLAERAPAGRDPAQVRADRYLRLGLGVTGLDILALRLTVAGDHADRGADLAGLRDIEFLRHIGCRARPATPVNSRVLAAGGLHRHPTSPMPDETMKPPPNATPFCRLAYRHRMSQGTATRTTCSRLAPSQ